MSGVRFHYMRAQVGANLERVKTFTEAPAGGRGERIHRQAHCTTNRGLLENGSNASSPDHRSTARGNPQPSHHALNLE